MIDAAITKPPAFDVVVVHSFSRFFRGQFQLEFYVRRLAKSGRLPRLDHPGARRRSHEQHDPTDHRAVRRVSIQGERQARAAGHEGERASGILERPAPGARPAHRSGRERGSYHRVEKSTAAHTRRH